jgi:hypothetical protein
MSRKFDKRLAALEKELHGPLPLKDPTHPRFYEDGTPLPPEIIAKYKHGLTDDEYFEYICLPPGKRHVFLSPEEQKRYVERQPKSFVRSLR